MVFESYFDDDETFSELEFNKIVEQYNLSPDFILTRDEDKIIINEVWSSPKNSISVDRIYEFDTFFIDMVPIQIKRRVLEEVLDIYVFDENYEDAIIVRDMLKLC
jgi:hypothetical protein